MRLLVLGMVLMGLTLSGWAEEYRVFTDKDGREIKAKIIKMDPRSGKVTMERDNRRRVTVPANIFSEADQSYIKEWMQAQVFMSNSKLRVSIEKQKGKTGKDKSQTKREKAPCHFEIKLDNRSGGDMDGVRIEYCTYMNRESLTGGTDQLRVDHGRGDQVRFIQGKFVQSTPVIPLFRYYSESFDIEYDAYGGSSVDKSYNKIAEDNIEGIRVRLFYEAPSGNVFTREICEPASIADKYAWKASSTSSAGKKGKKNR